MAEKEKPKAKKSNISLSDFNVLIQRHKKISLVILVILILAVLALLWWGISSIVMASVNVGGIVVKGDVPYSHEELIEAAELDMDGKLHDVDTKRAEEKILLRLPYIYEVKVKRSFPNRIKITARVRDAEYYTELSGRYFALSEKMTVLEEQKDEDLFRDRKLTELVLPNIYSAVLGQKVGFGVEDTDYGYIDSIIERLSDSQFGDAITQIDVENKFEMSFVYDGRKKIVIGSTVDLALKLTSAYESMTHETFDPDDCLVIDVTNPMIATATPYSEKDFLEIID